VSQATQAAERAAGSSFYTGMRILPRAQREAMFEIYAFCRAVDDIADDPGPREPRLVPISRRSMPVRRRRSLRDSRVWRAASISIARIFSR
jgi:phytoene/squalene synthetase